MSTSTIDRLPSKVERPAGPLQPWNTVPLGVSTEGEVSWDILAHPGLLIRSNGKFGGVPTVIRTILAHLASAPSDVRVIPIGSHTALSDDVTRSNIVLQNDGHPSSNSDALGFVIREMSSRITAMDEADVDDFRDLPQKPFALVITIENIQEVLSNLDAYDSPYYRDLEVGLRRSLVQIAQYGKRAGIYLILGIQRSKDIDLIEDKVLTSLNADYNLNVLGKGGQESNTGLAVFGVEGALPVLVRGYYTHRARSASGWVGGTTWEQINRG